MRDSFLGHSVKCIYQAYISHVSWYSLDQKKASSRSRLGHSRVSSRSRLGQFGKRLGLVSVSGTQVSVLVSVSTQKVLGPSLVLGPQIFIFSLPNPFLAPAATFTFSKACTFEILSTSWTNVDYLLPGLHPSHSTTNTCNALCFPTDLNSIVK